jgi:hypothetical protein
LNAKNFELTEKDNEIVHVQDEKVAFEQEIAEFSNKLLKIKDEQMDFEA